MMYKLSRTSFNLLVCSGRLQRKRIISEGRVVTLKNFRYMLSRRDAYETSLANGREERRRRKDGRWQGRIIVLLLLVCAVVTVLVAADYWMNYGKIYRGVSVGSVPLGGKTPGEAQQILEERAGSLEEIELTGPQKFTVPSDRLGVNFDVEARA